jgi:hypothetical protein
MLDPDPHLDRIETNANPKHWKQVKLTRTVRYLVSENLLQHKVWSPGGSPVPGPRVHLCHTREAEDQPAGGSVVQLRERVRPVPPPTQETFEPPGLLCSGRRLGGCCHHRDWDEDRDSNDRFASPEPGDIPGLPSHLVIFEIYFFIPEQISKLSHAKKGQCSTF